jgi:hypothetical protein
MTQNQTQDIMKAGATLINSEYKASGKWLSWAMAIGHFSRRFTVKVESALSIICQGEFRKVQNELAYSVNGKMNIQN